MNITLHDNLAGIVDLGGITEADIDGMSASAAAKIMVTVGNRRMRLGKVSDISGDSADDLVLAGVNERCINIGQGMTAGRLTVQGDVGDNFGREMKGGELTLAGNAGDKVGSGMRGGIIRISGNAGDSVGGPVPGATKGMNEGVILIRGNAGACLGERMRRGLIVVDGNTGSHSGDRMIAGTIMICGQPGAELGAGMRRGTLLLPRHPTRMPRHLADCGEFELAFVPLLADWISSLSPRHGRLTKSFSRARRYCGDLAYGGNGEVLVATLGGR